MTNSDRDTTDDSALATDVRIELSHLLFVDFGEAGVTVATRIDNVLAELFLLDLICLMNRQLGYVELAEEIILEPLVRASFPFLLLLGDDLSGAYVLILPDLGVILHVRVDDEGCECVILLLINFVLDNRENVKTRQNWLGQVHVVDEV